MARIDCDTGRINAEHSLPRFPSRSFGKRWQLLTREANDQEWNLATEWEAPHG